MWCFFFTAFCLYDSPMCPQAGSSTAIAWELVTLSCFIKHQSVHRRVITHIQYSVHVWVLIGFRCLLKLAFMLIDLGFEDYQSWENNRKCLSFPEGSCVTLILSGVIFLRLLHLSAVWLKALSVRSSGPFRVAKASLTHPPPPKCPPTEAAYSVHSRNRSSTRPPHGSTALPRNTHHYNKLYLANSVHTFDAHCEPWPFACITCMQMCT